MSIVKSYAIGDGDMYYIRHATDNFTVIDCCIPSDREGSILSEIATQSKKKGIHRFISTHPDQDHLSGLCELDDNWPIVNFYVVDNDCIKPSPSKDFKRYCKLRDSDKSFRLFRGCKRKWMNQTDDERRGAGLHCLWPIRTNKHYKDALEDVANGMRANNVSIVLEYSVQDGATMIWMGDLETDFMEKIEDEITLPKVDVLFAPHHGRDSGRVPSKWLGQMDPGLVIVGEAPSKHLNYYRGDNTMTQNSCGDILFDCHDDKIHIYVEDHAYEVDFLDDEGKDHEHGLYYVGTLQCE